ncbi:MAG: hypothetical protein ACPL5F_11890 [Moorellaceae bacterium]
MKRSLHVAGGALGALGVVFVIVKLAKYGNQIDLSKFNPGTLLALFSLAVVYGTANLLLALAWRDLLNHLGMNADARWAVRAHGLSQLAKYVPGNIFHLAGRQAIGIAAGLPAWPLAKSVLWELGILSITGSFFALLALPFFMGKITVLSALILFLISVSVYACVAYRWFSLWVARAVSKYAVFLALSGLIFASIIYLVVPAGSPVVPVVPGMCGGYVVAWLAGLLTPGTPAGAGVRELVLFAILHPVVGEADLLAAILLGRIVTVIGDAVYYLLAVGIPQKAANVTSHGVISLFHKKNP